jgi:ubiquitin-like 1-activating enzyme E1 B
MPTVPRKARLQAALPLLSTTKRPLEEDGDQPPAKRQRTQTNGVPSSSPSKGYKEVDGIIIVEDGQDDDIIIIED